MKTLKLTKHIHSASNKGVVDFLSVCDDLGITVKFKLDDRLEERGMSLRKCSELTGLRLGTLSDIMNGNKTSISFLHLWVLMISLSIQDINDLIELSFPEDIKECVDLSAKNWIEAKKIPQTALLTGLVIQGKGVQIADYKEHLKTSISHIKQKKGSN